MNPEFEPAVLIDGNSPANGFLRVLPASHLLTTEGMPLGFEKVPGEVAVYCDGGDVMLHGCDYGNYYPD